MLTKTQIEEIREHLEKAQNPVFFYDNDADGLCSFIILRRFLCRGKGVAVRSYPDLNAQYAKRAQELNADYIFILDKPLVNKEFIDEVQKINLPIVWLDHHLIQKEKEKFENVHYYNPVENKPSSSEPITYQAYKITNRKEDLWLAIIGCVADHYMPDFATDFAAEYPQFWASNIKQPFDVLYKTEIGRIARAFNFGLKNSVTNVVHMQNFIISCKGPEEIFTELSTNKSFRDKVQEIKEKYNVLLEKAKTQVQDNLLFFDYAGDLSISADLSNELCYIYPDKYIAVAYMKGPITNISLRGKNVKKIIEKILISLENASGGGHEDAVGSRIQSKDLAKFRELLESQIK